MAVSTEDSVMGPFGFSELLIILAIVVIIFGASRLPQLGKGLGEGIQNFRDGLKSKNDKPAPADKSDQS